MNTNHEVASLRAERDALLIERDALRNLLDRRPAINSGLVDAYTAWTGECYRMTALQMYHREAAWRAAQASAPSASTPNSHDSCKRCNAPMGPGLVVEPYYDCSDEGTCSIAPGPATLAECRKCHSCGWSTT